MTMLNNWQWWMQHRGNKIKSRCRKGIPRTLRGKAWRLLCGSVERRQAEEPLQSGLFDQLADRADQLPADHALQEFLEIIERDLDRTFPHHDFFREKGGSGQQELRRLLRAYAVYNPALGYCQVVVVGGGGARTALKRAGFAFLTVVCTHSLRSQNFRAWAWWPGPC